jgi:tetratricopeptide (TPR) repeat protein
LAAGAGAAALLPGLGNRPGGDGGRPGIGDGERPGRGDRPTNPQERRDNLQDRLDSRNEYRDQNQQDRQERRDEVREDWQDRYGDIYENHDDWHHGFWHGNAGDWWHHMWDDHTALMAFGTTMWGINRAAYGFGYWGYSNPYYVESYPVGGGVSIDYSEPIVVEAPATAQPVETGTLPVEAPAPGIAEFEQARQAFYQGDYAAALAGANKALGAMPNDPIIHEFRALVMFAQGKYAEAAAGLYSVLSVGPGWDWTTLSSLYPSVDAYTKQLRTLEDYCKQHLDAADARFVLAYHYLTTGNTKAATTQLQGLYHHNPQDPLVAQLLMATAGPEALGEKAAPPPETEAPAVPASDLVGNWSASGQKDARFAMQLTKDGNFSWTYTAGNKKESVKGVYAVDGNVLALEPESGGVMLAEISQPQNGRFDFKILGAPPTDPGLKFVQGS